MVVKAGKGSLWPVPSCLTCTIVFPAQSISVKLARAKLRSQSCVLDNTDTAVIPLWNIGLKKHLSSGSEHLVEQL